MLTLAHDGPVAFRDTFELVYRRRAERPNARPARCCRSRASQVSTSPVWPRGQARVLSARQGRSRCAHPVRGGVVSEAMAAEFDTLAEWTAQVATDLGSSFKIPAACPGSGSQAVLDWLIDELHLSHGGSLLDCGAGMGGPAAYAVQQRSVRPLLVEPERGACRAARSLFGHPVVRASALALSVGDDSFDAAWSLGVLCNVPDQLALLTRVAARRSAHRSNRTAGLRGQIVHTLPAPRRQPLPHRGKASKHPSSRAASRR